MKKQKAFWLTVPLWGLTALQTELNGSCEQADATASETGKLFLPWLKLQNLGLKPSSLKATGTTIATSFHAVKKDAKKCYFIFLTSALLLKPQCFKEDFMLAANRLQERLWMERSCCPARPAAEPPTVRHPASELQREGEVQREGVIQREGELQHLCLPAASRNTLCPWGDCSQEAMHPQVPTAKGEASRFFSQNPFCSFHSHTSAARGRQSSCHATVKGTRSWVQVLCCSWALSWSPNSPVVEKTA